MPTTSQNFSGDPTPRVKDTEYVGCNFSQSAPQTRLFPGDDTPRTFVDCNLVNCLPPPGSTVKGCNTTQVQRGVEISETPISIGGRDTTVKSYVDRILGRLDSRLKLVAKQRDIPIDPPEGTRDAKIAELLREKQEQATKDAEISERETALADEIIAEPIEREVIR